MQEILNFQDELTKKEMLSDLERLAERIALSWYGPKFIEQLDGIETHE